MMAPAMGKVTATSPQRLLKLSAVGLVLLGPLSFRKHRCHSSQRGVDVVGDMRKLQQLALAPQLQRLVQARSLLL